MRRLAMLAVPAVLVIAAACGENSAPTATAPQPIGDTEAHELLEALVAPPGEAQAALDRVVAAGDERFTQPLIDVLWARGRRVLDAGPEPESSLAALEALTGAEVGADALDWIAWYGATDLDPPPGYTSWKGRLLAPIDPRFTLFLDDEHASAIRTEEIVWGGVTVDGIPPLDRPRLLRAGEADYLEPADPVFGLVVNGDARAYPLRIMDWHEMANDVVGGVPISLAYCTLCGAAIAYDGRAPDGETYTFGTSGLLYRSNKLMYDRTTHTLWNQFTGEPVLGPLVGALDSEGEPLRLDLFPLVVSTWHDWRTRHPETRVLDIETGYFRPYENGAAYGRYFADYDTAYPVWNRGDALPAKDFVYGLRAGGARKAFPISALAAERVVNDRVGDRAVVLVTSRAVHTQDTSGGIAIVYSSGGEVRAFERGELSFAPGDGADTLIDGDGGVWRVTEEALLGPAGERLARLSGHLSYWFSWSAFHPDTEVYGLD